MSGATATGELLQEMLAVMAMQRDDEWANMRWRNSQRQEVGEAASWTVCWAAEGGRHSWEQHEAMERQCAEEGVGSWLGGAEQARVVVGRYRNEGVVEDGGPPSGKTRGTG